MQQSSGDWQGLDNSGNVQVDHGFLVFGNFNHSNVNSTTINNYQQPPSDRERLERFQRSLYFEFWDSRQQLAEAHEETYKWIWKSPDKLNRCPSWDSFPNWLENGNGIYWINGKAGSGKSTLLNYIVRGDQSDQLDRLLNCWASYQSVVTPTFFFWRNGQPEQRSITGLIKSLILQILEKATTDFVDDLNPVLEGIGFERCSIRSSSRGQWCLKELTSFLQNLIKITTRAYRICFFVDGVDEFEGDAIDQQHLVEFLCEIAQRPNTKMCISSRPEPHLIQIFSRYPKLKLQDLNRGDIENFLFGRLAKLQIFITAPELMKNRIHFLVAKLLQKAQGVFLWARLAVSSLFNGSWRFETLSQLYERVDGFDDSLHGLFRQLLSNVDDLHKAELAVVLGLVMNNTKVLMHDNNIQRGNHARGPDCLLYIALASECGPFAAIHNMLLKDADALLDTLEAQSWRKELRRFKDSLVARSAGLLDVSFIGSPDNKRTQHHILHTLLSLNQYRIEIIHRSLSDFLRYDKDAQQSFGRRLPSSAELETLHFEASMTFFLIESRLLRLHLQDCDTATPNCYFLSGWGCIRLIPCHRDLDDILDFLKSIQHSHVIDIHLQSALRAFKDCVSSLGSPLLKNHLAHHDYSERDTSPKNFLESYTKSTVCPSNILAVFASQKGLYLMLPELMKGISASERTLELTWCLFSATLGDTSCHDNCNTIRYLLAEGALPNGLDPSVSIRNTGSSWLRFLRDTCEDFWDRLSSHSYRRLVLAVVKSFIAAGADLSAVVECSSDLWFCIGDVGLLQIDYKLCGEFFIRRILPTMVPSNEIANLQRPPRGEGLEICTPNHFRIRPYCELFNEEQRARLGLRYSENIGWKNTGKITQEEESHFGALLVHAFEACAKSEKSKKRNSEEKTHNSVSDYFFRIIMNHPEEVYSW